MAVADWSTTASLNTTLGGITLDGSVMTPSQVDDAFREVMAQLKTYFTSNITWTAVQTISASGVPLNVDSTNSNGAKIALKDNGTVRGYIGADSTGVVLYNSSGVATYRLRNDGQIRTGAGSAAAPVLADTADPDTGVYFDGGLAIAIDGVRKFRVQTDGDVEAIGIYDKATASAANVFVDSAGVVYRSTSALKYKTNLQSITDDQIAAWLSLDGFTYAPATDPSGRRFFGFAADEAHDAGLTELVTYDADGHVEGYEYGRDMAIAHAVIKRQQAAIAALEARLDALEG